MTFDVKSARSAGYSDDEIADHLGQQSNFDVPAARKSGYGTNEIIDHLSGSDTPAAQRDLVEGVKPSTAGAGRGITRPAMGLGDARPSATPAPAPVAAAPVKRTRDYGAIDMVGDAQAFGSDAFASTMTPTSASVDEKRTRAPGRVTDADIPGLTPWSTLQDAASGALQIGPTVVQGVGELARLATGDRLGKGLSDFAERGNKSIQEVVGSERGAMQRKRFEQDMADKAMNPADVIIGNPGALADQVLPTVGSMAIPIGVSGVAGKLATSSKAAQIARAIDEATVLNRANKVREAAAIGATVAQNSASTYSEIRDKGGEQDAAYLGAAISAPASYIAGRLTGGGAEVQAAKLLSGAATGAIKAAPKAMLKEGAQEIGEEVGGYVGETVGTGQEFDANAAGKRLAVAGTLGAVMGGGVEVAGAASEMRQQRIKTLTEAGDTATADLLQKKHDRLTAIEEVDGELQRMPSTPEFANNYRNLRGTGMKPAEAAARSAVTTTFQGAAVAAGIPDAALATALEKANGMPLDEVPAFLQKFTAALEKRGLAQPGAVNLGEQLEAARDDAIEAAMGAVYQQGDIRNDMNDVLAMEGQGAPEVVDLQPNPPIAAESLAPVATESVATGFDPWQGEFDNAKSANDNAAMQSLYDRVSVILNGPAQARGDAAVTRFEKLKAEIETYAASTKNVAPAPVTQPAQPVTGEGAGGSQPTQVAPKPAPKPFAELPDLDPEQQQQLDSDLADANEREYQQGVKESIQARLGLIKPTESDQKKTPFKTFLRQYGIAPAHTSDIAGKNRFKANNMLPATFRAGGLDLDSLVERAIERGFMTEADRGDQGKLISMIQSEIAGDAQVSTEFADDDAAAQTERAQRMEIEGQADKLGLPYSTDTSTDQLASMVNRVQKRMEKEVDASYNGRGSLKSERVLANAREVAARIERKRAQYNRELRQFAEAAIGVQDFALDAMTDEDGNPVIVRAADISAVEAWLEENQQWDNGYGTDSRANQDSGQTGAPVASSTQAGPEPTAQAGPQEQRSGNGASDQSQEGSAGSSEGLTATTPEQVKADEERATQAEKAAKTKKRTDDELARKAQERKDIAARSESAADSFVLGGDALQNLSGQGGMFDEPAPEKIVVGSGTRTDTTANGVEGDTSRLNSDASSVAQPSASVKTAKTPSVTELRPNGTLVVKGDQTDILQKLREDGITKVTPMDGGVMVGKSEAQKALDSLSPDHSEKLNQNSNSIQQNETEDLKSPDDNQPSNAKPDALVELRKRESVLKALRKCLAA